MVRSEPGIRVVDVDDEADLHAWWSTGHAAGLVDRPYDAWPPWELSRRALTQPRDDQRVVLLAARPGGREAGAALVVLPSLDRVDTARIEVWTRPGLRRRGVGAALLGAAEAVAAAAGRRLLDATTYVGTGEDERGDGARFARRHGWSVVEESDAKLLELDAAAPRWDPLTAEVREHLGDHRVLLAVDRVPDVHAAGFCALLSAFASLLPPSAREHGDASWDLGRLRAQEARDAQLGRRRLVALALAPDGMPVGFSDLRVDGPSSPLAGVGGTLVLPAHRGRRLGLALKLASHRGLLDLRAAGRVACTHVETENATSNRAMNDVNERLGYRRLEVALDLQRRITPLRD